MLKIKLKNGCSVTQSISLKLKYKTKLNKKTVQKNIVGDRLSVMILWLVVLFKLIFLRFKCCIS